MTEVYYPNSSDSADLWPQALDVGEHIHHAMVDAEFQTYVWWYIRRSYGPMREDGQISKRGAMMAHFARFVRPGYVRIEATANPASNVYVSAYQGSDSRVVIVALNKGTSAVSQQFSLANSTATSVSSWLTDASRNVAPQGTTSMSNGSLTITLPPRSMMTFVTGVGGNPSPTPTPIPSPSPTPSPSPSGDPGTGCRVSYTMNTWNNGFTTSISITNTGSSAINGWTGLHPALRPVHHRWLERHLHALERPGERTQRELQRHDRPGGHHRHRLPGHPHRQHRQADLLHPQRRPLHGGLTSKLPKPDR